MRILLAPLWVRALYWSLLGAVIALAASMFSSADSHRPILLNWPTGTVLFVVVTAAFGALLTWRTQETRLPYLAQVRGLTPAQRAAAIRATTAGEPPADPEVLKAALRLGTVYLDQHKTNRRRYQLMTALLMTAAVLLLVIAAYNGDAWGLVYPVLVLIVIPLVRWWNEIVVSRTRRQNKLLQSARRSQRKKRV
ncbi:hypothetical protein BVC93_05240 [Mycobacterium sp. MS1601]|uniref:hypothetical protein n=1 Tax=Mycobacterium sp. MS1601 TaxID=1936029 RepID=UPI0009792424|nr:hypothetical protein [Mycobacterium sp. MS1601]AQA01935.1 hypothetical protein BVC93_05240 [Mycobacterium sp. MS1601]